MVHLKMKLLNRKLRVSYIVAALILCSFLVLQFYWLQTHMKLQQEARAKRVQDDLPEITAMVERDAFCQSFYSRLYLKKGEQLQVLRSKVGRLEEKTDTIDKYVIYPADTFSFLHQRNYPVNGAVAVDIGMKLRFMGMNPHIEQEDSLLYDANKFGERVQLARIIDLALLDSLIKESIVSNRLDTAYSIEIKQVRSNVVAYRKGAGDTRGQIIHAYFLKGNFFQPYEIRICIPYSLRNAVLSMSFILLLSLTIAILLIMYYIYFVRQITAQEKLSKMKAVFINNATHELRTPITNINLAVDNWRYSAKDASFYMDIIDEESHALKEKIDQILEFSSFKTVKKRQCEQFNVHELIRESVGVFSLQLEQLKAQVSYELNADDPCIIADKRQLMNAVHNVIDNAIKYRRDDLHIKIRTANKANVLELEIEDNGIGMEKHVQKNIFDEFYRADTGNVHNVKGFGLGLSYARYVIEAGGGAISAKSEFGEGSVFTIQFSQS